MGDRKHRGIGCRGDDKRMPNQSRPFRLAGPFPPAPLPAPGRRMALQKEAQSGSRNLNEWPALEFLDYSLLSHQTSRFLQGLD